MSHPVGPAVLPKDARPALSADGRTTANRPVPFRGLGSPPAGPRRAPGRLGTLTWVRQESGAKTTVGVVDATNISLLL